MRKFFDSFKPEVVNEFSPNGTFVIMLIELYDTYIVVCNDKNEHDNVNRYNMSVTIANNYFNDLVDKYSST